MKLLLISQLFEMGADLIADQPVAAAKLCRSMGQLIRAEHEREEEKRESHREENQRRGFPSGGGPLF